MAGAVFAEVGAFLLAAGAALAEILGDNQRCIFHTKCAQMGRVNTGNGRCEMTSSGPDHAWIMVGLSSNRFVLAEAIHGLFDQILNSQFRGRRNIW